MVALLLETGYTRQTRGIGYNDAERALGIESIEIVIHDAELLVVPAVEDNIEATGGELTSQGSADTVTGAGDESPRLLAVWRGVTIPTDLGGAEVDACE